MSWINKNWKALTVVGGILGVSAYASKYFDVEPVDDLEAETKGKYLPYKKSNSRFADEKHENMNERLVDLGFGRTNYFFPEQGKSWSLPFDLPVHHAFYEDENGENRSVLAQVLPHDAALIISNIKPADRNKIIAIILGYNDYEDESKIMLDYPDVEITDEIVGLESDVVSMLLQVGKITDFRGNTLDEEELYRFGAEDFGADEDYYEDYIQRIFTFIDEQVGTEYFPSIEDEEEVARFKKGFYDEFDEVGQAIEDANDFSWRKVFGAEEKRYPRSPNDEILDGLSEMDLRSIIWAYGAEIKSMKDREKYLERILKNEGVWYSNPTIDDYMNEGMTKSEATSAYYINRDDELFATISYLLEYANKGGLKVKSFEADTADVDFDEAYMEKQDAERIMKLLKIVRRKATGSNARYAKNYAREAENAYYQYGMKGLKVQVAYVLSNLGGWRGDEAKEVKAELRKLTK